MMFPKKSVPMLLTALVILFVSVIVPGGARLVFAANPWTQQAQLTALGGSQFDEMGFSSAISADGNVAIIGAEGKNDSKGAAYIFSRSGANWFQRAELTGLGGVAHDNFGHSVALSADGGTAIVGARGKNTGRGAAFVFTGLGSSWSQQAELTANNGAALDDFGISVALSVDGNTAIVGAEGKNSAYVFTRSGSDWTQQGNALIPSDGAAGDHFGFSVALGADGNTALISAIGKNSGQGKVYLFTRSASTWNLQGELMAGDGIVGDGFGISVALSANGSTALIGASSRNSGQGAAYVFTRFGSEWTQQGGALTAHDGVASDYLGWSVALSADGEIALIGADGRSSSLGATYVFTRSGAVWTEQAEISADNGVKGDTFGFSVAISGDGSTAVCGAIATNGWTGSLYVFAFQQVKPTVVTSASILDITSISATGGGNVTSQGWASVTERGGCWSTSANPTTADNCTHDGSGTGVFTSSIIGLLSATTYHVRAYATNTAGTAYGDEATFSTNADLRVTLQGVGVGEVHSSAPDINCSNGLCTQSYPYDSSSSVTLTPTAGARSLFGGWQGSCSTLSGDCVLTMDSNRAVLAIFNVNPAYAVWIDPGTKYYDKIGAAYLDASETGVTRIKACRVEITENLDFNLGKLIVMGGGYNSSYLDNSGVTTLIGTLTLTSGSLTVDNLVIR